MCLDWLHDCRGTELSPPNSFTSHSSARIATLSNAQSDSVSVCVCQRLLLSPTRCCVLNFESLLYSDSLFPPHLSHLFLLVLVLLSNPAASSIRSAGRSQCCVRESMLLDTGSDGMTPVTLRLGSVRLPDCTLMESQIIMIIQ